MSWTRFLKVSSGIGATVATFSVGRKDLYLLAESEGEEVARSGQIDPLSNMQLKHVQVYFRHGARTPIHIIPVLGEVTYDASLLRDLQHTLFDYKVSLVGKDNKSRPISRIQRSYESKPKLKGGAVLGSLTTTGQDQMFSLGQSLRRDYRSFLDRQFKPQQVYMQSTNIDRTIASLRCVLAGPISIPVSDDMEEILFPNGQNCPVVRKIVHAAMIHFDDISGIAEDREFIEEALDIQHSKGFRKLNFIHIRDDLIAREVHGYQIPPSVQPHMDIIEKNAIKIMYHAFSGQRDCERDTALRLTVGLPVTMNVDKMEDVINGKSKEQICLYSTHDSTLVALLCSLDIFDHQWPPFAADVRFELYQDNKGKYWVRVLYLGKEQKIRGCNKTLVPFEEFKKNMKPMTIKKEHYLEICNSNILEQIGKELLVHEKDEVEDEEDKEDSEKPAGM
ncbi:hypothetical protein LOTGIDRAFT_174271 [Lottia gigantea]|uniref:Lysophosphatidic acid phosphatase type 6 n=1 Tax=Lottia gigantea TaxID=225164 RepID=V4AMT8_LOTGI|nr:hypothetical protein LOTGIDRAFT_174271 [Lottia gigantea]ESO98462.1 hypothetical protein LOTGIDRAFT_174271 [Lottia gigantea]